MFVFLFTSLLLHYASSTDIKEQIGDLVIPTNIIQFELNNNKIVDCVGIIIKINNDTNNKEYTVLSFITELDYNQVDPIIQSKYHITKCNQYHLSLFYTIWPRIYPIIRGYDNKEQTIRKFTGQMHNMLSTESKPLKLRLLGGVIFRTMGGPALEAFHVQIRQRSNWRFKASTILDATSDIVAKYTKKPPRNIRPIIKINEKEIKRKTIVVMTELKSQNSTNKNSMVQKMNNSFGIILDDIPYKNRRNQTEYFVQSLFDKNISLRIRPKYIQQIIPRIYIHDISNCSVQYFAELWNEINNSSSFSIMYLPSQEVDVEYKSVILPTNYSFELISKHLQIVALLESADLSNTINKEKLMDLGSKLHLTGNSIILNHYLCFLELHTKDVKIQKSLSKIRTLCQTNLELVRIVDRFDEQSLHKLRINERKNVQMILDKLLDVKDKQKGRKNVNFWKFFGDHLKLPLIDTIHKINEARKYFQINSFQSYQDVLLSDLLENYFIKIESHSHFNLHVFTHNIDLLESELDDALGNIMNELFNINDNEKVTILVNKIITRRYH